MIRNSQNNENNNNNNQQDEQNFISDDDNSIDLEESNNIDNSTTSTNNMMVVSSLDENSLHDSMTDDSTSGSNPLVEHSSTLINNNSPTTMMTMNTTTPTPNNLTKPFRSLPPLDTRNLQPNLEFNRAVRQSSDNLSNRRRMRLYQQGIRNDDNSGDIAQQTLSNDDVVVEEETTTSSNNNTQVLNDSGIVNTTPSHHVYQEDIYTNMPTNNSSPSSLMITNQDSPTSVSTELMEDANGSSSVLPQNVHPMNLSGQFSSLLSVTPTTLPDIFRYNGMSLLNRFNTPANPPLLNVFRSLYQTPPSNNNENNNEINNEINNENNNNNSSHDETNNVVNLDEQPLVSPKPEEKELFDLSKHDIIPPTAITENCDIPHNFICPITKLVMFSPVRNMYGKVYERESIDQWWKTLSSKQQQLTDPLTNQVVTDKNLVEDVELKDQIQEFLNQNAHLRFSINDLYFPKQIIREMKVAIDSENYAKISQLLSQFPANFFVQTKFPVPPQSAQGKPKSEKETSVSVFDCLYRRFKTVFDSVQDVSPSDVHFMNDPIIGYVVRQYLIVRNYFIERQKKAVSKIEVSEFKSAESSISEGLKNIFVNSVRLFPNVSILDWLVSIGASISSTNQFKQNAFHMACMTDQVEIAKHLYHLNNLAMTNNPSSVNIVEERLSDEVKRKWNAFYLAIWHNSQRIIDWIVDDAHLSQRFLLRKHKCMVKDKSSIYHPMNALSLAAYKKNIPLMEVLIKKFSFEVPDEKYHPIYWSCIANDLNGFTWICDYIATNIPNGPDVLKSQLKAINERAFKRSLIHAIAMEASDDMMEYYLQKCKDLDILDSIINTQDTFGNTALHYACEKSKTRTIAILIQEGIAHEYVNRQGKIASQCCKTDEDREAIQKAIKEERDLLRTVVSRVKELESDVSFLKRKILEMEEFQKRRKFE